MMVSGLSRSYRTLVCKRAGILPDQFEFFFNKAKKIVTVNQDNIHILPLVIKALARKASRDGRSGQVKGHPR